MFSLFMTMSNVAIIGGGITGLTAAHLLKEKGVGVTLLDAQNRPGGVIRTTRSDGFLAEHGPNSILLTSPVIMEVIRDLGLGGRVLAPGDVSKNRFIARRGKPVPLPLSPLSFLATPLFSAGAKLRLLGEPFIRRAPADADESLAAFVRRRIGREFLDYAINPFVAGVYAGDPEHLSVRHSFPKLHALEQKHGSLIRGQLFGAKERKERAETGKNDAGMISFDEGLQVLTDTLAAKVGADLRPGTEVSSIRASAGKWDVVPGGGGALTGFDAVLYAGTAYGLSQMTIGDGRTAGLSLLSEIEYPPVTSLVLGFRRESVGHPLDGFGVLVPEVEPFFILGALFSSSLFPGRAPEGCVTLTCFLGGTRRPETATGETGEIVETAMTDLRRLLDVTGEPVFVHRAYYQRAIPQYNVGYGKYLDAMARAEREFPGLFLAGNFRDGISLGNSIVAGHDTAERIAGYIAAGPAPGPPPRL
jgi:oxygen-dependent protoporphyrinogen oxidase